MDHPASFDTEIPPSFDGFSDYLEYRSDIGLWLHLTTLPAEKHGCAIIARLKGEPKNLAKTLDTETITSPESASRIIEKLNTVYEPTMDEKITKLLNFTRDDDMKMSNFVAGFESRYHAISELQLDCRLLTHLLLQLANVSSSQRGQILASSKDTNSVKSALLKIVPDESVDESTVTEYQPGTVLTLFYPVDGQYYPAKVLMFDRKKGTHIVYYDSDQTTEEIDLTKDKWRIAQDKDDNVHLKSDDSAGCVLF